MQDAKLLNTTNIQLHVDCFGWVDVIGLEVQCKLVNMSIDDLQYMHLTLLIKESSQLIARSQSLITLSKYLNLKISTHGTIDIQVSRLAIGLQKLCVIQLLLYTNTTLKFCAPYNTSTGSISFKQYFCKSSKINQLSKQSACFLGPSKFLIWLVYT